MPQLAMTGLVVLALAGVMLGPASAKPEPWYRYYTGAEFEGFREAGRLITVEPRAVVLTGDWRPNMVAKTFAPDLNRAWYSEEYFQQDPGPRNDWNAKATKENRTMYVIVEKHAESRWGRADWTSGGWTPVWTCECGTLTIYRAPGGTVQ